MSTERTRRIFVSVDHQWLIDFYDHMKTLLRGRIQSTVYPYYIITERNHMHFLKWDPAAHNAPFRSDVIYVQKGCEEIIPLEELASRLLPGGEIRIIDGADGFPGVVAYKFLWDGSEEFDTTEVIKALMEY